MTTLAAACDSGINTWPQAVALLGVIAAYAVVVVALFWCIGKVFRA